MIEHRWIDVNLLLQVEKIESVHTSTKFKQCFFSAWRTVPWVSLQSLAARDCPINDNYCYVPGAMVTISRWQSKLYYYTVEIITLTNLQDS